MNLHRNLWVGRLNKDSVLIKDQSIFHESNNPTKSLAVTPELNSIALPGRQSHPHKIPRLVRDSSTAGITFNF